ncbi:MAG: carbonic anhydrase family protein [Hydrogenovibrio sp.]|nr:carbonic anhydrase family protein [Hydrogenovibrio sp.]
MNAQKTALKIAFLTVIWLALPLAGMPALGQQAPLIDLGAEAKKHQTVTPESHDQKPTHSEKKAAEQPSKPVHWGYSGKEAPRYWADLSPKFGLCKTGKNQSPINLMDEIAVGTTSLPGFDVHYRDNVLKILNNGHTVQVNYPLGSYIKINNHRYELMQFHFHTPSEHQYNGFNYPMELHLVHRDGYGNLAVIGILFQEGKANPTLQKILDHLPKKPGKEEIVSSVTINPNKFFPAKKQFFKYSGSLTTPPCTEGVYWMVFKQPIEASALQLQQMNEAMGENARPIQKLFSRSLLKSWTDIRQDHQFYEFY